MGHINFATSTKMTGANRVPKSNKSNLQTITEMSVTDDFNYETTGGDHSTDQSGSLETAGGTTTTGGDHSTDPSGSLETAGGTTTTGGDHSTDQSGSLDGSSSASGGGNVEVATGITTPATDILPSVTLSENTVKAFSATDSGDNHGNVNVGGGAKDMEEEEDESSRKKKRKGSKGKAQEIEAETSENTRLESFRGILSQFPQTLKFIEHTPKQDWHDSFHSFAAGLRGYGSGKGISDETLDQALKMIFEIGEGCRSGNLNLAMATTMLKGLTHEQVVAQKEAEAEIRGRNAQISIKLRRATESDGVPALGSGISRRPQTERGIFSLAEGAR